MVSYVEQAILRVKDESSRPIRKINRELTQLFRTARAGGNIRIRMDGIDRAQGQVRQLTAQLRTLARSYTARINFSRGALPTGGQIDVAMRGTRLTSSAAVRTIQVTMRGVSLTAPAPVRNINVRMVGTRLTAPAAVRRINITGTITRLRRAAGTTLDPVTVAARIGRLEPTDPATMRILDVRGRIIALTVAASAHPVDVRARIIGFTGAAPMVNAPASGIGGQQTGRVSRGRDPSQLGEFARYEFAFQSVRGIYNSAVSGFRSALEAQAEETRRQIILPPEAVTQVERLAIEGTRQSERVTLTRAEQAVMDLYVSGLRGDVLEQTAPHLLTRLGQAGLIVDEEQARQLTMLTNKLGNLANVTEDAERTMSIIDATFRASIIQGESFNASTALAALRVSGLASTLSDEGLLGFFLATDAMGRRAGESTQRLVKELTTPLDQAGAGGGVAVGAVETLIRTGLRSESGLDEVANRLLNQDPQLFAQTYIRDAIAASDIISEELRAGLVSGDLDENVRAELRSAISQFGFNQTSSRFIMDALTSIGESQRARALAASIDFDGSEAAVVNDLNAALINLAASFNTFSSETLDPLFSRLAPAVNRFAAFLENLALDDSVSAQLKRVAVAAGIAAGGLAIAGAAFRGSAILFGFGNRGGAAAALTGSALHLDAAAAALQRAAAAQTGAAGGAGMASGGGAQQPRLGFGFWRLAFAAYNSYGLSQTDFSREAVIRRAESLQDFFSPLNDVIADAFESAAGIQIPRTMEESAAVREDFGPLRRLLADTLAPIPGQESKPIEVVISDESFARGEDAVMGMPIPRTDFRASPNMVSVAAANSADRLDSLYAQLYDLTVEGASIADGLSRRNTLLGEASMERNTAQTQGVISDIAAAGGSPTDYLLAIGQGAASHEEAMRLTFDSNAATMVTTFQNGASAVNAEINSAAASFGPVAGAGLLAVANEFGAAAGSSFRAAVGTLNLNANINGPVGLPSPPVDTGNSEPN